MGRVIGIISGKGGVGKTTIALNLGLALNRLGENTIVVDGDMKNPNVGLYLGVYNPALSIVDVLKRDADLTEAQYMHSSGLKIIPTSLYESFNVGLTRLRDLFDNLEGYIILDFSPGLGRDTMSLLEICDESLIITNPNIPSVASTMKLINIIRGQGKNVLGVVINMSGRSYEISREDIELVCNAPILSQIPEDENIRKSAMLKTPVLDYKPYSKASVKLMELAAKISGKYYKPPRFLAIRKMLSANGHTAIHPINKF